MLSDANGRNETTLPDEKRYCRREELLSEARNEKARVRIKTKSPVVVMHPNRHLNAMLTARCEYARQCAGREMATVEALQNFPPGLQPLIRSYYSTDLDEPGHCFPPQPCSVLWVYSEAGLAYQQWEKKVARVLMEWLDEYWHTAGEWMTCPKDCALIYPLWTSIMNGCTIVNPSDDDGWVGREPYLEFIRLQWHWDVPTVSKSHVSETFGYLRPIEVNSIEIRISKSVYSVLTRPEGRCTRSRGAADDRHVTWPRDMLQRLGRAISLGDRGVDMIHDLALWTGHLVEAAIRQQWWHPPEPIYPRSGVSFLSSSSFSSSFCLSSSSQR